MRHTLITVALRQQQDVVAARQRARHIASLIGFDSLAQVQIATAVSEIARNALEYGQEGKVELLIDADTSGSILVAHVTDKGPGIANVEQILNGEYRSLTGMGRGIVGSRRLMDDVSIQSEPGRGTSVRLVKRLPQAAASLEPRTLVQRIARELAAQGVADAGSVLRQQDQDLVETLAELGQKNEEITRLNREIEDTNRGVVALYAELEERAEQLRRADDMKSRFLSNMSHEFRTPLNSIRALSRMLQEHIDGPLNAEQDKQVGFISKAASELSALVDDLLDLAKIEAGKIDVKPSEFEVATLFSTLRGMLRPLLTSDDIVLVFDEPLPPIALESDENKVAQILRNFISNAIKFTERGEVRVAARPDPDDPSMIEISVADTGIGIKPEDQSRIFEEFTQIANPLQSRVKGTGLGLPLCRKLARLLGGDVGVESIPGVGSRFYARIPRSFGSVPKSILIIDDDQACRYLLRKLVSGGGAHIIEAQDARGGLESALRGHPSLVILGLQLPDGNGEEVLAAMRRDPKLKSVPVAIVTSKKLTLEERSRLDRNATLVLEKRELDAARGRDLLALV